MSVWEDVKANALSSDGRFKGEASIAKKWEVYEISVVSVPADPTVGVGRAKGNNEQTFRQFERQLIVNKNMTGGSVKEHRL